MKNANKYFLVLAIFGLLLIGFTVIVNADRNVYLPDTDDGTLSYSNNRYDRCWASPTGTVTDGATDLYIGQNDNGLLYTIWRTVIFFDTSDLSNIENISGVNLRFYVMSDMSTTDFYIVAQQKEDANKPLEANDFDEGGYSGNYGWVNTLEIQPYSTSYLEIELSTYWVNNLLNKDGTTIIALRSYNDMAYIPPSPSTNEYVRIYSNDYGVDRYKPQLRVYYNNNTNFSGSTWYNTSDERSEANCSVDWTYYQSNNTFVIDGVNTLGGKDYGTGGWKLVSLPKNETVDKLDVFVRNDTNNYTWSDAISNGIILTFLYNWSYEQNYNNVNYFTPYEGFWMWFYDLDYDLWINTSIGAGCGDFNGTEYYNATVNTTHANATVTYNYWEGNCTFNITGNNSLTGVGSSGEPIEMLFEISEMVFLTGLIALGFAIFKKDAVLGTLNAFLSAIVLIVGTIEGLIESELMPITFFIIIIACAVAVYKAFGYFSEGDE